MQLNQQASQSSSDQHADEFSRLLSSYSTLVTQFGAENGTTLTPQIKSSTQSLIRTAQTRKQCEDAAKVIFTAFQKILSDRTPLPHSRKAIVFSVANGLFRLYFRLHVTRQFESIANNIISSGIQFTQFGRGDRVGYRFNLGRYWLTQQYFSRSRRHLLWAFGNCVNSAPGNKRLVLIYLITASLPCAIVPVDWVLGLVPDVENAFGPLVRAIRKGNYKAYHEWLDDERNRAWFDKYEIWYYLKMRCDLLLYRSLFRRVFMLTYRPTSENRPPTLNLLHCLKAIQFCGDRLADLDEVENIAVTLIDAGYIKGYIHHVQKVIVLDRRDKTFGFPLGNGVGGVARLEDDDDERYG